jgi:molybdopterin molybdotransferase
MKADVRADWIPVREAAIRVVQSIQPLDPERSVLLGSLGRALAEDLASPIDLPLWTNSAMDGFAVRSEDVRGASGSDPVVLRVVDDIPAGGFPAGPLPSGGAARITTGAPVPEGADTVIRVEHTDGGQGGEVTIRNDVDVTRNLRGRGEDLRKGEVALERGTLMTPAAIGVAASMGCAEIPVVRRPLVALLTSGDELVEVDGFAEVLAGRRIVSSNSYSLTAQLTAAGCQVRYLGIASDTEASLREKLAGAQGCDALITSAGISVGEHDHVKKVLLDLDTRVDFWRVRMRPGSPFAFGRVGALGGIPWFGLPGNPVSSLVTFELFAKPALLRMGGRRCPFARPLSVRLLEECAVAKGLTQFVRVRLQEAEAGEWVARATGPQGSGLLSSVAAADALLIIPEELERADAGDRLRAVPLQPPSWTELCPY